jgi:hypothetical protein
MTWVTWRQHRKEVLVLTGIVAVIGVALLVLGLPMHGLFPDGASACTTAPLTQSCNLALGKLSQQFGYINTLSVLLNIIPFAIGAFLGAPLLAREMEDGTWQLAWTQAVPRMRWLSVKMGILAGLCALLTLAFSIIITWYRTPLDVLDGRLGKAGFDVEGLVPVAYALFAFALATVAGVLLRRSLGGLAMALVVFVVVRLAVANFLRPMFATPLTLVEEIPQQSRGIQIGTDNSTDWVVGQNFRDAAGNTLDDPSLNNLSTAAADAGQTLTTYLHSQGIQRAVSYHPADLFWDFQLIEAGLYVGVAALLMALIVWRVKRRAL